MLLYCFWGNESYIFYFINLILFFYLLILITIFVKLHTPPQFANNKFAPTRSTSIKKHRIYRICKVNHSLPNPPKVNSSPSTYSTTKFYSLLHLKYQIFRLYKVSPTTQPTFSLSLSLLSLSTLYSTFYRQSCENNRNCGSTILHSLYVSQAPLLERYHSKHTKSFLHQSSRFFSIPFTPISSQPNL